MFTSPGFAMNEDRVVLKRRAVLVIAVCVLSTAACFMTAEPAGAQLITQRNAARVGLERAWYAQVPVDASRSRITNWLIYYDRLYCVSDSGLVTALNAETGAALWTKRIGRPDFPALGPGASELHVGVVSGSRLFLLDRNDGHIVWSRQLGGAPSSGPALTRDFAFIALVTGRIEGYRLSDPAAQPWYYQSIGRTYVRPTTTGRIVSWPTAAGNLYVSRADNPGVLFRLETGDDIVTSPAEKAPYLYIASLDGYLYALHEITGEEQWRYSTGYPVVSSPAIVGDHAYVASLEPTLHAIEAATGKGLWRVPGLSHFAAQGKDRVYASDKFGNLFVLDATTGQPLGGLDAGEDLTTLVNDQSDRIFLVNDRGLVQCLREIGAKEPTMYRAPEPTDETPAEGAETPTTAAPADDESTAPPAEDAEEEMPFEEEAGEESPFEEEAPAEEEPMDEPADEPMDEPAGEENPFEIE
jgi:outer membrane protein assembly factor BamB